ncbi:hypothetical protein FRB99_001254 [Tulasnella sp. 403]|nr:hypothetical protein FRB99_001254 [Tulasnella sp. 403]
MIFRQSRLLWLAAIVFPVLVRADKLVVIDGGDPTIHYTTVNNGDTGATWTPVQRSPDSCDTPQMLTSRLGDYMTFTFTGTGVYVVGTTGVKRGIINFNLDGTNTTFDRTNAQLMCDAVLFQQTSLPFQQHTVTATLIGRETNYQTGQPDGVLSVQRIRYSVPGSDGSSSHTGAIVGGIIAGVIALGLIGFGVFWYIRRNRRNGSSGGRRPREFFDADDVPGKDHTAGLVATPFQWGQDTNAPPEITRYGADSTPGSPSFASQPLLNPYPYSPSQSYATLPPGPVTAHTHSHSSGSDARRDSQAATTLVTSNPDQHGLIPPRMSEKQAMAYQMAPLGPSTSRPGPSSGVTPSPPTGPITDQRLVDRIAHRLADIMTERVGVPEDAPPPMYEGEPEPPAPPPLPSGAADRRQESGQSSGPLIPPAQVVIPTDSARGGQQSPPVASPESATTTKTPSVTVASPDQAFDGSSGLGAGPGGRFGPRPRPAAGRTSSAYASQPGPSSAS